MDNDFLDDMIAEKEAASPYLKLSNIGDSVKVFRVTSMEKLQKVGYGGKKVTALAFTFLIDIGDGAIVEKIWDNSAMKTFLGVRDAGIGVGSSFTLTRGGEDTKNKTKYEFTNVVNPKKAAPAPVQATIPTAPVKPGPMSPQTPALVVASNPIK